jgi:hypothetical protein
MGPSSAHVFRYVTASALLVEIAELFLESTDRESIRRISGTEQHASANVHMHGRSLDGCLVPRGLS